jgi:hypothetical protein
MENFRFKRYGDFWQVQKRHNIFWWKDLKVRSILLKVRTFKEAYYTLETLYNIKVMGVLEKPGASIVQIVYVKKGK